MNSTLVGRRKKTARRKRMPSRSEHGSQERLTSVFQQIGTLKPSNNLVLKGWFCWTKTVVVHNYIYGYLHLKPQWPLFLKVNLPKKQGRTSKQNQGPHLGSRQLHSWHMNVQCSLTLQITTVGFGGSLYIDPPEIGRFLLTERMWSWHHIRCEWNYTQVN